MWIGSGVRDIAYAPEVGYLATTEQALEHLEKARDAGLVQLVGNGHILPPDGCRQKSRTLYNVVQLLPLLLHIQAFSPKAAQS